MLKIIRKIIQYYYDKLTIEHLIPQSKIKEKDFGYEVIGQLGNLILVSEDLNGKLKNKSVEQKIKILKEEGYDLFPEIYEFNNSWSSEVIIKRTHYLGNLAYDKIWKI